MADTFDLRFLESTLNVRAVLKDVLGREPNAEVARGVSTCLQQGRMFFESASMAPLEIRPLPLYYGMMAFAKAIVVGRGLRTLATLSQSHGLRDTSNAAAIVTDLNVTVCGKGIFQEFNDSILEFEGLTYYERSSMTRWHGLPTVRADQLEGFRASLKEMLGRINGLGELYRATYREEPKTLAFSIMVTGAPTDRTELRLDTATFYEDRASLRALVEGLREQFPILGRWRFSHATKAWDNSILIFSNREDFTGEFDEDRLIEREGGFYEMHTNEAPARRDFRQLLEPLSGGIAESWPVFVQPLNGLRLSDIALSYMAMFLLSSLVRYRPLVWVHAVSRHASTERPADDQALALLEMFMNHTQQRFLKVVHRALTKA